MSKESSELSREQRENLAYAIWEARNDGREAPDEDWYEAERRLKANGYVQNAGNGVAEDEIASQLSYLSGGPG